MPRYIEIEKFLDELDKQICSDCIDEDAHCCSCGVGCARGIAKDLATADVVQKSEVDNAKADVAMEIFAEIESKLMVAPNIEDFDGYVRMLLDDFCELKKKYTEGE